MLSSVLGYQICCRGCEASQTGLREGREKGKPSGCPGQCRGWMSLMRHTHTHTLAAECSLSAVCYTLCLKTCINIKAPLSVGLSLWHAAHPWDRHGFYYDECKWNLFCMSDTVAWTLWGNDSPQQAPPHSPPLHYTYLSTATLHQRFETWSSQFALDEKQIPSNCNRIR